MAEDPSTETQSFGAGIDLYLVVGGFAAFFVVLSVFVAVKQGEWTVPVAAVGGAVVLLALPQVLRLEVGPDKFKYRNLSGSREVKFADVRRAYFEVIEGHGTAAAAFWVDRSSGKRVKVNLRTFPVRGAAALFSALEARGVVVEVPAGAAARRVNDQVRAAQAKPLDR